MKCLLNMVTKSELLSQAVIVFAWSSKKHMLLHYPDWRLCIFCWLIQDNASAAFSWSNWMYLLELIIWFSGRSSEERTPFQFHHKHNITFFGWRLAFGVVGGGSVDFPWFFLSTQHITVEQIAERRLWKGSGVHSWHFFLNQKCFSEVKVWVTHMLCVDHTYNVKTSVLYETEPLQSCRMFRMWLWHPGFLRACF